MGCSWSCHLYDRLFLLRTVACDLCAWFILFSSKSSGTVTASSLLTEWWSLTQAWCSSDKMLGYCSSTSSTRIYSSCEPQAQPLVAELLESSKSLEGFPGSKLPGVSVKDPCGLKAINLSHEHAPSILCFNFQKYCYLPNLKGQTVSI